MAAAAASTRATVPTVAKARGKKLERPNLEEYRSKISAERRAVADLFKRMNELTQKVQQCRGRQLEYTKKRDELRHNLDDISTKIGQFEEERTKLLAEIEERQKVGREMKSKVQTLKRDLGFQSEQEIDEKIREIERHMIAKKLTVHDENKMIAQIKQLRKNKPLVGQYSTLEADANSHAQVSVMPLRVRFDELRDELRVWQQKKRDATEKVRTLLNQNQDALAPLKDLIEEREALRREIALHRQEELRLSQEMEAKNWEYQTQALQLQKETRQQRREEQRRQNLEHAKENIQKQLDDIVDEGWSSEYQLARQIFYYTKKLADQAQQLTDSASANGTAAMPNTSQRLPPVDAEGRVLLKLKHERDEDYYAVPSKKKAEKRQKKPNLASLKQPLVHDISVLSDFERLGVTPPLCLADCSACLKALDEKMTALKDEQSLLEESVMKRKEKLLARLKALENPTTANEVNPDIAATTNETEISSTEHQDLDASPSPVSDISAQ